mmetsp:Transcript_24167/g.45945  ORF Transcript_24167/g.45945 Transcript_24167/m.45945 type:complete len:222 (+) Transcript_24167:361-1026(+)
MREGLQPSSHLGGIEGGYVGRHSRDPRGGVQHFGTRGGAGGGGQLRRGLNHRRTARLDTKLRYHPGRLSQLGRAGACSGQFAAELSETLRQNRALGPYTAFELRLQHQPASSCGARLDHRQHAAGSSASAVEFAVQLQTPRDLPKHICRQMHGPWSSYTCSKGHKRPHFWCLRCRAVEDPCRLFRQLSHFSVPANTYDSCASTIGEERQISVVCCKFSKRA